MAMQPDSSGRSAGALTNTYSAEVPSVVCKRITDNNRQNMGAKDEVLTIPRSAAVIFQLNLITENTFTSFINVIFRWH
jgi:hypothetical protein